MNYLYRIGLLLALAGGPVFTISSCSSDKKEDPQPTTGSLAGTVSPVGSISRVTATDAGGLTFLTTPDATTGIFSLNDLQPGPYTLSFETSSRYLQPADRSITIVAGQEAAAGTIQANINSLVSFTSGTMSWSFDGQNYTTTTVTGGSDAVGSHAFYLNGTAVNGSNVDDLQIRFPNSFSGVGTYTVGLYIPITYNQLFNGVQTSYSTGSNLSGSLTVSTYDVAAGTASGTFDFAVYGGPSASSHSVSNGTFSVRF